MKEKRSVQVIKDLDGNNIAIINDIIFKGKRNIKWRDVEKYLKQYVGEFYKIAETKDMIFIGSDLPNEYTESKYTKSIFGTRSKAKANLAQGIPEVIEIATNKRFKENLKVKHNKDAKYGWYKYDIRFGLPIFKEDGDIERYNVFRAVLVIRASSSGKLYLYDIIDLSKDNKATL